MKKAKSIINFFPRRNTIAVRVHPEFKKQLNELSNKYESKGVKLTTSKLTYLLSKNPSFKRIVNREVRFDV